MNQKKRYFMIMLVFVVCLVSFSGCEKKEQTVKSQETFFVTRSTQIQSLCKGISTDLWENSKYLNTIYTSRELYLQTSPHINYEIAPELYLNIPREDDHGALYATGFTTIKPYVIKEIDLTVPLDSIWKNTQAKYPEILQQYYIHKYSFIRVYPFMELARLFSPRQNLTKQEVFQVAQGRRDHDPKVIWFQPKWDPTYQEMILDVAFPVRDGYDLVGVLGCKVSLKQFLKDSAGTEEKLTGIIGTNGTLITAEPILYQNLGMPIPKIDPNPKQIADNEDLRKSSNPAMRTLMKNLINSPYTNFVMNSENKSFYVECRLIPGLNWVIFKMSER
jgi:hypothetical protein